VIRFLFTQGNSSDPFLLLRAKNLGFADATIILMYLVCNLIYALAFWPSGHLPDHIGGEPLLVLGYLTYGIVSLGLHLQAQRYFGDCSRYTGFTSP
jgi:hypothetical protein